jgi:hypothetical protein
MILPFGYWLAVIGADLFNALATFAALASAAQQVLPPARRRRFLTVTGLTGVAWAALVAVLAARGVFHYAATFPFPFIALAVTLPVVAGIIALRRSATLRSVVSATPQTMLVGIQTTRVVGPIFLVAMLQGYLPAVFALPAGIGDLCVGLAAASTAFRARRDEAQNTRAIAFLNIGGILDFVVALSVGFLASTTPFRLIFSTPSTDAVTVLPLVLIPAFGVPLFLLLHMASLNALRAEMRKGRLERRPPAVTATPPVRRPA